MHHLMEEEFSAHPDWTEKYRPKFESELIGNKEAISKIKKWIAEWENGIPKKRSILLVGPPGVGKTSIARAIALEKNWNIIELNASEERNAAAIRKAATSGAVNNSLFSYEGEKKRSIILLDEVDHMSGRISKISEKRILNNLSKENIPKDTLVGDTGGKAELLNLISNAREPIILACNDVMRFWGLGSGWKDRKDRFTRKIDMIQFKRASNQELKEIAQKILKNEQYEIEISALEKLVLTNVGDIRALIKDLQSLALESNGKILISDVEKQISIGSRDHSIDLFPGLEKLYKSKSSKLSQNIMTNLDKTPDEMIAWISWNNPRIHTSGEVIAKGANFLSFADSILPVMYDNKAYRSWYWGSNISALSSGIIGSINPQKKLFLNYPEFLRRGNQSRKRNEIIGKISKIFDINQNSSKNEFYPLLVGFHNKDINKDWTVNFSISHKLGLDFSEFALISGIDASKKASNKMQEKYEHRKSKEFFEVDEKINQEKKDEKPDGQTTLF